MKQFCVKHHLNYTGAHCPMCEKERISSFKVSKTTFVMPGQASRESYFEEYKPSSTVCEDVNDLADLLASKFGNVSLLNKK